MGLRLDPGSQRVLSLALRIGRVSLTGRLIAGICGASSQYIWLHETLRIWFRKYLDSEALAVRRK